MPGQVTSSCQPPVAGGGGLRVGTYQVSRNMLGSLVEAAGRESEGTAPRFQWSGSLASSRGAVSAYDILPRLRDIVAYSGMMEATGQAPALGV